MTKTIIPLPDGGYGLVDYIKKSLQHGLDFYMGEDEEVEKHMAEWKQKLLAQPHIPCLDSKEGEQHHEWWSKRVWMETDEYVVDIWCNVESKTNIKNVCVCDNECTNKVALPAPVKEDLWEEAENECMKTGDFYRNNVNKVLSTLKQKGYSLTKKTN